jgi:hypothetical protein
MWRVTSNYDRSCRAAAGKACHAWRSRGGERGQLGRIPLDLSVALAGDTEARARYDRKVYWPGPGQCAFFLGALGSGGHGRFRAGTRQAAADRPASLVVPAHVYGAHAVEQQPASDRCPGRATHR